MEVKVREVSENDFNYLLETSPEALWKQQKKEPFFYLTHKEKIIKIFVVLSELECKSGILYKSFNFVEDECVGFIPMNVLAQGNNSIADYVMRYKLDFLFDYNEN